jgi:hypothetical protein
LCGVRSGRKVPPVLGSATTEDERYTPLTCPFCGLEGRSPAGLMVVMCPGCQSTFDLPPDRPPPPDWTATDQPPPRPEITVLPDRPNRGIGIAGALLFLIGIGIVLAGDGVNLAIAIATPVAVVGLALLGHWGARPPFYE